MTSGPDSGLTRRHALTGAAAVAGLPLLVACGEDDPAPATDAADESGSSAPSPSETSSSSQGGGAEALAATSDVPVGGCFVVAAAKVVVTQPSDGDFRAFSAICTHQGCPVTSSTDGVIPCNCHGSQFSLEDGSVVQGPATSPLEAVEVAVDGDAITLV